MEFSKTEGVASACHGNGRAPPSHYTIQSWSWWCFLSEWIGTNSFALQHCSLAWLLVPVSRCRWRISLKNDRKSILSRCRNVGPAFCCLYFRRAGFSLLVPKLKSFRSSNNYGCRTVVAEVRFLHGPTWDWGFDIPNRTIGFCPFQNRSMMRCGTRRCCCMVEVTNIQKNKRKPVYRYIVGGRRWYSVGYVALVSSNMLASGNSNPVLSAAVWPQFAMFVETVSYIFTYAGSSTISIF